MSKSQAIEVLPRCEKCGSPSMKCYGNIAGAVRYRICTACAHRQKFRIEYCDNVTITRRDK